LRARDGHYPGRPFFLEKLGLFKDAVMKRFLWISVSVLALIFFGGAFFVSQFSLSALPEPGKAETLLATKAKHFFVRRASRAEIPPSPKDTKASLAEGDKIFGTDCSECHGNSGRKPTDSGRWMYPRAADLGSAEGTFSD